MKTIEQLTSSLMVMGSDVTVHREEPGTDCPCRTPEGFRDPAWHRAHPTSPVCNEQGILPVITEFQVKAAVQPAFGGTRRLSAERVNALLGDVQRNDHLGIFPCKWDNHTIDFHTFSESGEDFVIYDERRFLVVAADKIPDIDGDPSHHWEVGLRLVGSNRGL